MTHPTKTSSLTIAVFTGAVSLTLYGILSPHATPSAIAQAQPVSEDAGAAGMIARFGHGAVALCAASGASSDAAAAIAELAAMDTELTSLADLQSLRDAATEDAAELRDMIWRGGASPARLSALSSAESELTTRQSAVDQAEAALRDDLRNFFVTELGANNVALMDRFHANRDRRVPDAMKALDLTESQWRTLESACVKSMRELTLTTEESTLLTQCQSDQTTILVASRLTANLASIETVFNNALAGALE